jgi:hypothetical protein
VSQKTTVLDTKEKESTETAHITRQESPIKNFRFGKMPLADAVKASLDSAMSYQGKISPEILLMEGMSGKKYRYFINNVIEKMQSPRYLEVGAWAGSTLCSAIYKNSLTAVTIDNWAEFGGPINQFFKNLSESCSIDTRVNVVNSDFRKVNFASLGKFNVYLFDGPHAFSDQYDGLSMALDCLDNEFLFIVDDWNWEQVREGTLAAIADLNLTIVSATEIRTTLDNSHPAVNRQHSDWHNGYYIAILRK